jgi:predicted O-methyltransferase YrrM
VTDEPVNRPKALIDRLYTEGRIVSKTDGKGHDLFPLSITCPEGEALRDWVKRERAVRTIETGFAYGISALFICDGLLAGGGAGARHVACDPNQADFFGDCGLQVLAEAGVDDLVEFHCEPSEILLPRLLSEGRSFDLGFIDGNHRFEGVFLDLFYLGRLVSNGGIIFVDDYQLPAIARAVGFCTTNLGWELVEVSAGDDLHQWVVLRTPASEPWARAFDSFEEF